VDNRFSNAAFDATLPGLVKYTLLGLIKHLDNDSHETYISTKKLAFKMGVSYNTVKRSPDNLEELGVITCVGSRPVRPGSADATKIYKIHLAMILKLGPERPQGITETPEVGASEGDNLYPHPRESSELG